MFRRNFDAEQFFHDTVTPILDEPPEFERDSRVPLYYGTIPLIDLDDSERFRFQPCRLGYYPVSKLISIGVMTMGTATELPKRLVRDSVALPDAQPFDGLVVGRYRSSTVIGLRDPETRSWHQVSGDRNTKNNALYVIRTKVHSPKYQKQYPDS